MRHGVSLPRALLVALPARRADRSRTPGFLQTTEDAVFVARDFNRAGLQALQAIVDRPDPAAAKATLVARFRTRITPLAPTLLPAVPPDCPPWW